MHTHFSIYNLLTKFNVDWLYLQKSLNNMLLFNYRRRVTLLEWHPTAENILLSAGYDHRIIVWNISKGQAVNYIDCHTDVIYSMSFNRYGRI